MRSVILTGDPANTPARQLLAALIAAKLPPSAVLIDPPPTPRASEPEPGALGRYAWYLRVGGTRYALRKMQAACLRMARSAGKIGSAEPALVLNRYRATQANWSANAALTHAEAYLRLPCAEYARRAREWYARIDGASAS